MPKHYDENKAHGQNLQHLTLAECYLVIELLMLQAKLSSFTIDRETADRLRPKVKHGLVVGRAKESLHLDLMPLDEMQALHAADKNGAH